MFISLIRQLTNSLNAQNVKEKLQQWMLHFRIFSSTYLHSEIFLSDQIFIQLWRTTDLCISVSHLHLNWCVKRQVILNTVMKSQTIFLHDLRVKSLLYFLLFTLVYKHIYWLVFAVSGSMNNLLVTLTCAICWILYASSCDKIYCLNTISMHLYILHNCLVK